MVRLDFHLVQLFFACMPSLAVYLVAQYARYEIRRMEACIYISCSLLDCMPLNWRRKRRKKKEEAKAKEKEKELNAAEEKEVESNPELLEVRVRLHKLEETLKEIVVESKKQMNSGQTKAHEGGNEK
ncbi:hypothetical protein PRUPE_1G199000 [Prunus persica]|uniref:Uncharacterized protein n=1 Tax=Prunus persica TaxID=3760 RepID=A0A251R0F2_PRUPE|nr:hypothetical protein PRUPE_1G199000 [Prunus persica]